MTVVVSVYTTAMSGSKNKRFSPAKYDVHGRDAKKGGNDAAAQQAAAQYAAERVLMTVFWTLISMVQDACVVLGARCQCCEHQYQWRTWCGQGGAVGGRASVEIDGVRLNLN